MPSSKMLNSPEMDSAIQAFQDWRSNRGFKGTVTNATNLRLNILRKGILLPKQTHPGCFAAPISRGEFKD